MVNNYLPLLVILLLISALFRDDFSFTLLYLFLGAYALGTWWSRRSLASIKYQREYSNRAFLGETVDVCLQMQNRSWLPVPWLRIHEGLPVELSGPDSFQQITQFSPRQKKIFRYQIEARRRGYYPIGPIFLTSSDILGLSAKDLRREGEPQYLTVYPKIIPLSKITFPSQSPLGTLRHIQPVFEDPTRVMGKRPYSYGDSLRRVDWKSTATTGTLQVKLFEPSIALETVIFLNLNADDYHYRTRIASTELAVVLAASVANWVVEKQQSVGFFVNGMDPLSVGGQPEFIPARSGRPHLIRILDILARIRVGDCPSFLEHIRNQRFFLPWGTTLTIITGSVDEQFLNELHQARMTGLSVKLVLCGAVPKVRESIEIATCYGIPVVNIVKEQDIDIWRK